MFKCLTRKVFKGCCLLLFCASLNMQVAYTQSTLLNWHFDKLTTENGLSQNTATCFVQDNLGFLWIGTENGLNRYDAATFKIYRQEDSFLPDNYITCLTQDDEKHVLWIGTQKGGLVRLNTIYETFDIFAHDESNPLSLSKGKITVIFRDSKKRLWIGTSEGGLNLFHEDTQTFDHYRNDERNPYSLAQNHITDIVEDDNGNLWIATAEGGLDYFMIEENRFEHFRPSMYGSGSSAPSSEQLIGLAINDHQLWIATKDAGLNLLDLDTRLFSTLDPTGVFNQKISTTFQKIDHQLFVGTQEDGLIIFDTQNSTFSRVISNPASRYSLSNNHITSIFQDRQKNIWIGTLAEGINKYNPLRNKFEHFREEQGSTGSLPDSRITSIYVTKQNHLWAGTASAGIAMLELNKKQKQNFVSYQHQNNTRNTSQNDKINCVFQHTQNSLWVATAEGVDNFDVLRKKFTPLYFPLTQNKIAIKTIYQDNDGVLWIGTYYEGLIKYNTTSNKFTQFKHQANEEFSLSNDYVRVIKEDKVGNLWIGTENGLNMFDKNSEKFVAYHHQIDKQNTLSNDEILSLDFDQDGNVWIGTANGLNKLDIARGVFTHITEKEGLPNNTIQGVICDAQNRIWVSTNYGVAEINPYDNLIRTYDVSDGLQGNEFIANSCYQDHKGFIYFGGMNGFNRFHPDSLHYNQTVPTLAFTSFSLFNKPVSPTDKNTLLEKAIPYTTEIRLPYDANVFSLEFSVLDFLAPQKNQYAYFLENFDREWHYTKRNFVTYTNLSPGEYVLKVKGANSDGVWNEEGITLKIIITPPIWQTWWFRVGAVALVVVLLLGGYRIRTHQIQEQKMRLEYLVEQRTNELSEKTWQLKHQTEKLERQNTLLEQQSKELQAAYENVKILSEVGQKITATLDMRQMIETVYQNLKNLMPAERFGIAVFNQDLQRLEFPFFVENGTYFPFHTKSLSDKKRLSVICYERQEEIVLQDFETQNTKYAPDGIEMEYGKKPQSAVYLPLSVEQHTIGVITVQSFTKNAYSPQQLTLLRSLAAYTAVALDNASAYRTIETNNRNITDSIRYALTIQQAMLPETSFINELFADHFVIFKPLSMVSGDFYWFANLKDKKTNTHRIYAAVIDCTGHGVPGGFMSVIGKTLLDEIINTQKAESPAEILEQLDKNIRNALKQDQTSNDDGMDVVLVSLEDNPTDKDKVKLTFAGAKRPLYVFDSTKKEFLLLKGQRRSIGGRRKNNPVPFTNQAIELHKNAILYLTTDGFVDQPNPERQKIGSLAFASQIEKIVSYSLEEQQKQLLEFLEEHQQESAQVDDITVLGLKI